MWPILLEACHTAISIAVLLITEVCALAEQIGILLVVAGYQHLDKLGGLDAEGLRQHFEVNAIGPILAVQALRPNLGKGTKVGFNGFPKC